MKSDFDDELLSAYLDDELSAPQRAHVEEVLAERPESRELLDELRALRTTLGDLPRHRLPEGFAANVMRQSEQETLSASPPREAPPTTAEISAESNIWRRLQRPLTYAGLAAAASVLIMLYSPDEPQQIALHDAPPAPGNEAIHNLGDIAREPDDDSASAFDAPQIAAPLEDSFSRIDGAKLRPDGDESGAASKQSDSNVIPQLAGSTSPEPAADAKLHATEAAGPDLQLLVKKEQAESLEGLLVVRCEVSPEAISEDAFARILTGQKIAFEEESGQAPTEPTVALYSLGGESADRAQSPLGAADEPLRRMLAAEIVPAEDVEIADLVLVEADADQIRATLAQLSVQRDKFLHVAVEPTSRVAQPQQWRDWSYGEGASRGRVDRENKYFVENFAKSAPMQSAEALAEETESALSRRVLKRAKLAEIGNRPNDKAEEAAPTTKAAGGRAVDSSRSVSPPTPFDTTALTPAGSAGMVPRGRSRAYRFDPYAGRRAAGREGAQQKGARQLNSGLDRYAKPATKADDGREARRGAAATADRATVNQQRALQSAAARIATAPQQQALFVFTLASPSAPAAASPAAEEDGNR